MRLKLSDLQRVVNDTLQEKKHSDAFCNEVKNVFGPSVMVGDDICTLAEAANDKLDIIEYMGHLDMVHFPPDVAMGVINHESSEVRKFVARILPEGANSSLVFDSNENVRLAASKKTSLKELKKAVQKFSNDIALKEVFESRLIESKSALEAAAEHSQEEMLSEIWYESVAKKLIQDYGKTLDTTWKTSAVKQYCSSVRATTRLPVDEIKLMDKMNSLLQDYEKLRAKELGLTESLEKKIQESFQDEDEVDVVDVLLEQTLSPQQYIEKCDEVFNIKHAVLPPAIMKYKIREGLSLAKIPVYCTLPHGSSPRRIDEIALDSYVKHWNDKQKMMGEPFKLRWDSHSESINKITFKMELK